MADAATRDALEAGFRHFDCAERYRNEREVGAALQAGAVQRGTAVPGEEDTAGRCNLHASNV